MVIIQHIDGEKSKRRLGTGDVLHDYSIQLMQVMASPGIEPVFYIAGLKQVQGDDLVPLIQY